jgi:hypothetical protein
MLVPAVDSKTIAQLGDGLTIATVVLWQSERVKTVTREAKCAASGVLKPREASLGKLVSDESLRASLWGP